MENLEQLKDYIPGEISPSFWKDKRVLITGHTGFKGSWLLCWLECMGAKTLGLSLPSIDPKSVFHNISNEKKKHSYLDLNDYPNVEKCLRKFSPEIVFHLAAQPLVRESYKDPLNTYKTNVIGTLHLLEASRSVDSIRSIIIITTDKCYENKEWNWGYRENDPLGGYDPYSNSKACVEMLVSAYRNSFFPLKDYETHRVCISTARAGNIYGGGDRGKDRLIPDAVRSIEENKSIVIRNPHAIRPWQYILDPLRGYLVLAQKAFFSSEVSGSWNFAPNEKKASAVSEVMDLFCRKWGEEKKWIAIKKEDEPHETTILRLDCSQANALLHWEARIPLPLGIGLTVEWYKTYIEDPSLKKMLDVTLKQIYTYGLSQRSHKNPERIKQEKTKVLSNF